MGRYRDCAVNLLIDLSGLKLQSKIVKTGNLVDRGISDSADSACRFRLSMVRLDTFAWNLYTIAIVTAFDSTFGPLLSIFRTSGERSQCHLMLSASNDERYQYDSQSSGPIARIGPLDLFSRAIGVCVEHIGPRRRTDGFRSAKN